MAVKSAFVLMLIAMLLLQQASADDSLEFVKQTVAQHPIVVFSKSYCPYCKRAKAVFAEMKETPHVLELDLREDGESIQQALQELIGRRTVPQVFINGKYLGGSDDTVNAYESGHLKKLLSAKTGDGKHSSDAEL